MDTKNFLYLIILLLIIACSGDGIRNKSGPQVVASDSRIKNDIERGCEKTIETFLEAQRIARQTGGEVGITLSGRVIQMHELSSTPQQLSFPIKKEIAAYQLPETVTFAAQRRRFWYDYSGKVDFFEEDRHIHKSRVSIPAEMQADIVIIARDPDVPYRCLIDLVKKDWQIQFHYLAED